MLKSAFFLCFYVVAVYPVGTIILVNGTSSSGKSSIISCLKQKLQKEDIVFVSIDEIGWTPLLDEAMERGLITFEMSDKEQYNVMYKNLDMLCDACEHKLMYLEKLYDRIQELALHHRYVLFDTVFYMRDYQDIALFWKKMESCKVYSILVYCSPEIIAQRVMQRNADLADDQKRDLLSVVRSFCLTYSPTSSQDNIVDFLRIQDIENLLLNVQTYLLKMDMPQCLIQEKIGSLLDEYKKRFFSGISQNLSKESQIGIGAQFKHDVVINTTNVSPESCAQCIVDFFDGSTF